MEGKEELKNKIPALVRKITEFMNLDCQVELKEESTQGGLVASIYIPENGRILIGKNGQNLKALEHVIKSILLKGNQDNINFVVDVNDYKKSRAIQVLDLARQVVTRVRNTQKAEALSPMSAYERRVIHMELTSYPDIATESIGEGLQRRIIIKPYP